MSDLSARTDRDAATNVMALEQICALRAWLATVLTQTLQAEATIKYRIAVLEQEIQGLRTQLDQTTPAIESLRQTIHSVDDAIRRRRHEFRAAVATQKETETKTERQKPVEDSNQGRRSGRRKHG
jgi:chromosome segregation ATPase